jgi:tetratricopeptide (TPR) repeat protein
VTLPPGHRGESDRVTALRLVDQFQRALQRRDRAEIVDRLREMVAVRVPMADQWLKLALMAIDLGEIGLARAAADLYVESFDGSAVARFRKVGVLARIGAFEDAMALLRSLPPGVPDAFSCALARGATALNLGATEEAREWLDEALRLRPQAGQAWHSLSLLVDFAAEPDAADRLIACGRALQEAPPAERAFYYYALGKAHADRGEPSRAFAAVTRAASETRALFKPDRAAERQAAMEGLSGYDPGRIAAIARQQSEPTGRSIFVMGLPRSGTTLVEQILTSHSGVAGGAEADLLRLLVHEVGDASYGALSAYVQRKGAPPLARLWQHLVGERFPQAGRVVDKTTDTTRKLGVAASLLPEAPLIWLTRNPLDCAWSCFRTCFMQGVSWSNDLADIAVNFRLEDHLLAQWQRHLGERLLVVPYEELATEPEAWIRKILAHCGLDEEPQAFAPHANPRVVTTASVMQVRRPIGRQAIGSAEPYRALLKPFVEAYYD